MAGRNDDLGEKVKSEISVMPFEQTTLVSGNQVRGMATMMDLEREMNSQREQLIRVTYTLDRQVARLSREMEMIQERQAPEASWRVREDVDALSRRLDALEAFCRPDSAAKAADGSEPISLQAQIGAVRDEVRALHAECALEQTRDVAGARARAAVEQVAAKQRTEMEKLHCQMADLQRSLSSQDNTPTPSSSQGGDSSQSLHMIVSSVEPALRTALDQQLGRIVADLRGEAAGRYAELRAEILGRLDAVDGGSSQAPAARRRPGRSQTLASVSEHPQQPSTSPSPGRARHISQDASSAATTASDSGSGGGKSKEAAVHELDAAVDRLVSKVNLALEGSVGPSSTGGLQESTEVLKKFLKDLGHDKTLSRSSSAVERQSSGSLGATTPSPAPAPALAPAPRGPSGNQPPHVLRVGSPNARFRSGSPSQANQKMYASSQFRGFTQSMAAPPPQGGPQYPRAYAHPGGPVPVSHSPCANRRP